MIKVMNPRNGLSKEINTDGYSLGDIYKTINVYSAAGFKVVRYGL